MLALEQSLHIEVQRLSEGSRLLCPVKDSDPLDGLGKNLEEIFLGERPVEVNGDQTVLPALLCEVVDGLLDGLGH